LLSRKENNSEGKMGMHLQNCILKLVFNSTIEVPQR